MIDKENLKQMSALHEELKDLNKRIKSIENKETTTVKDSVQGSSTTYPYIQHSCVVEGVEYPKCKRSKYIYKKQIKSKQHKLDKLINQLEYELNYVENSEIRQMLRYKYEDGCTNYQVAHIMNENNKKRKKKYTEDSVRMQLERFFKKN